MKRVMCIAQTDAKDARTDKTRPGNPKFGDILTVVDEVYVFPYSGSFYIFSEYAMDDLFQSKWFVPIDESGKENELEEKPISDGIPHTLVPAV